MNLPLWFAGFVQKKIRFLPQQYLISVEEDLLTDFLGKIYYFYSIIIIFVMSF